MMPCSKISEILMIFSCHNACRFSASFVQAHAIVLFTAFPFELGKLQEGDFNDEYICSTG